MNNTLLTVGQLSIKKNDLPYITVFKAKILKKYALERKTLQLNKHTNVYSYECSGLNSVETKQPYDFLFSNLVITLHMYQIVVPIKRFKSPFQVVKGQMIYC